MPETFPTAVRPPSTFHVQRPVYLCQECEAPLRRPGTLCQGCCETWLIRCQCCGVPLVYVAGQTAPDPPLCHLCERSKHD